MQNINEGIFGIDVSRWQGNIDWNRVKSAGVNVAIIKASGADDGFYEDSRFQINYQGALASGIKVGAYHFFTEYEDANAQAEYFSGLLSGKQWDIKPAIDVESGLGDPQLTDKVITFCERVKALTGLDCVIYCNTNYARNAFDSRVAKYPLWVAHYGVDTPGDNLIWQQWAGFQYSSDEYIDGIGENTVDKDRFTEEMFLNSTMHIEVSRATAPESVACNGTYIVQNGDTLSDIAAKYGITYQELAKINGIANPNLISVGQVLNVSASALSPQPTQSSNTYVVQSGDTLSSIAERFGISWQVLAQINNISNPDFIQVGQVLDIYVSTPQASVEQGQMYTIQAGDTLSGIADRFGTDYQTLANINGIADPNLICEGQVVRIN